MKNSISSFKIAAAYIGTVVGAGFATGQEILQFFSRFGAWGLIGLLFTTAMFILFGYIIMELGNKLNAHSHLEIIKYAAGNWLGTLIDIIITFFLFGAFTAMIAGTGALFSQQFHWPSLLGNIIMAVLTALTVLTGVKGVINSISFFVPFLFAAVIGTSVYSIINTSPNFYTGTFTAGANGLINNWLLAAILYVSYNIILSIAVLGSLGANSQDNRAVKHGAVLGGLGLGVGSILIYLALAGNIQNVARLEVPMIYIAGGISYPIQLAYAVVLITEVYSTAVGSLYGFVSRMTDVQKHPAKGKTIVIASTLAGLLASQLGFSNLVKILYPLVGYGGIVLLISLIYTKYREIRGPRYIGSEKLN